MLLKGKNVIVLVKLTVCIIVFKSSNHCFLTGKMKVKEVKRTANIAWSPAAQYPIYLAAGTAAQQLDATFR